MATTATTATTGLTFSEALTDVKAGKKASRTGWAAKGEFIAMFTPLADVSATLTPEPSRGAYIAVKSGNAVMPWTPSHADLLASDWEIVA